MITFSILFIVPWQLSIVPTGEYRGRSGSLQKPLPQEEKWSDTVVTRLQRREQLQKSNTLPTSVTGITQGRHTHEGRGGNANVIASITFTVTFNAYSDRYIHILQFTTHPFQCLDWDGLSSTVVWHFSACYCCLCPLGLFLLAFRWWVWIIIGIWGKYWLQYRSSDPYILHPKLQKVRNYVGWLYMYSFC